MSMHNWKKVFIIVFILVISSCSNQKSGSAPASHIGEAGEVSRPNFVIILTDDQGYQDVGCFGSPDIKTPYLDRMAEEGMRFTSFYAQTICGPSRASLMTGCYPNRVATEGNRSLEEEHHPRMHDREITIAEVLKKVGYTTAAFGKWDLAGHSQTEYDINLLPTRQGFDFFFGTPTSNDAFVNLLRGEHVIERHAELSTLTSRYTDEAIGFMKNSRAKPFFVYIAHSMPHIKLAASEEFVGKSERGLYGDVVEELDWNVGRLLKAIKDLGLDESTYVMFMSDNGPWHLMGELTGHGGSAGPLRGSKTSAWEGGLRVPCIMRAPGRIPEGVVCDGIASTLDLLPTLAALGKGSLPDDRVIDGHDITDLMIGREGATSPTQAFYYYQRTTLRAVRAGKWKLHLVNKADKEWGLTHIKKADHIDIAQPMLFDLENDIGEQRDVASKHPEVVAELLRYAAAARKGMSQRVFQQ
jgi:arylsulfatase A-like enzyme